MNGSDKIIECVPNVSEGNSGKIIDEIKAAILSVEGVVLLHVDPNKSANRTVFTFAGYPHSVIEAAYRLIKTTAELIDMSKHTGRHPRIGATDVCPIIPVSNISMDKVNVYALNLAKRVGDELSIPVYCYENSSTLEYRKRLEQIRQGEYENFPQKIKLPEWKPDFGPEVFNYKSGATVIGARKFLIAFNVNLKTQSVEIAKKIAENVRESGKWEKDTEGNVINVPGKFKNLKAIGWYISDFNKVQVSMNITDYKITPILSVYEAIKQEALNFGTDVEGSELIGLIPKNALIEAGLALSKGETFSNKQLIEKASEYMGLSSVKRFDECQNILENLLGI